MNLDDKVTYLEERIKLCRLKTKELESLLEKLYWERFVKYDITLEAYYRIASQVYNVRTRKGSSLIYHLKKFLG